jgi:hypothetical protein
MPLLKKLQWCEVAERLVRAHGVVGFLPLPELAIESRHLQRAIVHLVELLGMSALSPFDRPIELRGARGQNE